jgi:hypothetical protein
MKNIIFTLLTLINYIFIISIFIFNYMWKIDIWNDPLLWILFLLYIFTLLNWLAIILFFKKHFKDWFYNKVILINKFYILCSIIFFIILWIIL